MWQWNSSLLLDSLHPHTRESGRLLVWSPCSRSPFSIHLCVLCRGKVNTADLKVTVNHTSFLNRGWNGLVSCDCFWLPLSCWHRCQIPVCFVCCVTGLRGTCWPRWALRPRTKSATGMTLQLLQPLRPALPRPGQQWVTEQHPLQRDVMLPETNGILLRCPAGTKPIY